MGISYKNELPHTLWAAGEVTLKNDKMTQKEQLPVTEKSGAKRFFSWFLLGADPIPLLAESIERLTNAIGRRMAKKNAQPVSAAKEALCDTAEATEAFAAEDVACVCADRSSDTPVTNAEEAEAAEAAECAEETNGAIAEDAKGEDEKAEAADGVLDAPEAEDTEEEDDEEDGDEKELSFHGFGSKGLRFVDVMEEPELYRELKEREARGEIALVTRYRRTFESRVALSDDEIRKYYSALKNKLLSYRGVKSRISRNVETYNKGRINLAKLDVKSKSLYLYLGMDYEKVAALEDGKYHVRDCSQKKKYESVPTLFKIRGPRKLKYAMELLDLLCNEELALEKNKKYKMQDFSKAPKNEQQLIEQGILRMLVAEIPAEN